MKFTLPKPKLEAVFRLALLSGYHDKAELFGNSNSLYINDNQAVHVLTYAKFEQSYGFTDLNLERPAVRTPTLASALKSFDCKDVTLNSNSDIVTLDCGSWHYEENAQQPTNNKFDFEIQELTGSVKALAPANISYKFGFSLEKSELSKIPASPDYTFVSKDTNLSIEMEHLGKMNVKLDCIGVLEQNIDFRGSIFGAEFQNSLKNFEEGEMSLICGDNFIILSQQTPDKRIMIAIALQALGNIVV